MEQTCYQDDEAKRWNDEEYPNVNQVCLGGELNQLADKNMVFFPLKIEAPEGRGQETGNGVKDDFEPDQSARDRP